MDFSAGGDYVRQNGDYNGQYWWAFVVFALFAFIWGARRDRRDDCGDDGVLKYVAAGNMMNNHKRDDCDHIWDVERDMMNQFAQTRMEAQQNKYDLTRDSDRYFYEQQKTSLVGFKDVEIQGLQNTSKIESRIDALERTFKEDIIRKQGEELNFYKTVQAVRGWGIPPSQPMFAAPYPYNCNPCGQYA